MRSRKLICVYKTSRECSYVANVAPTFLACSYSKHHRWLQKIWNSLKIPNSQIKNLVHFERLVNHSFFLRMHTEDTKNQRRHPCPLDFCHFQRFLLPNPPQWQLSSASNNWRIGWQEIRWVCKFLSLRSSVAAYFQTYTFTTQVD